MRCDSVAQTHTGLIRDNNQDSLLVMPEFGVFLVADGMGGEQAGDEASQQVVATVKASVEEFFKIPPADPSQILVMLRETLVKANQEVFQISVHEPDKRGLGSTASMLCLHRGVCFVAQVGDSRIYLIRNGQVKMLTRDHTVVWNLYEQGLIARDQLESHPERHLLTQCIGSPRPVLIDTLEGQLEEGDLFLICSDGLTGYAPEEKIFAIMANERLNLEERAQGLVDTALEAGGGDNVSVVLARVSRLDLEDDWTSAADQPMTILNASADETTVNEEISPAPALPGMRRGQHLRSTTKLLLGTLALALLILLAPLLVRPRPIKVYLRGRVPEQIEVTAVRGERPPISQHTRMDRWGAYLLLPEAGRYELTLKLPGFVPQGQKVLTLLPNVDSTEIAVGDWVALALLTIKLPAKPQTLSLRVMHEDHAGLTRTEFALEGQALAGRRVIHLSLAPGFRYTVLARADGYKEFTSAAELRPGERRMVVAAFAEAAPPAK